MSSAAGRELGAGQCGQGVGSLGRMGSGAARAGGQWGSVAQAGQAGCGQQRQGAGRSQGRAQAAEVAAAGQADRIQGPGRGLWWALLSTADRGIDLP